MKILFLSFFICVLFIACGDDNGVDCTSQEFNGIINNEVQAVNDAGNAWALDPTQANCDAFKQAAQDYIDAIEDFGSCNGISQTEYDQAVQAARAAADAIPC